MSGTQWTKQGVSLIQITALLSTPITPIKRAIDVSAALLTRITTNFLLPPLEGSQAGGSKPEYFEENPAPESSLSSH
jgi:hypothetical protein